MGSIGDYWRESLLKSRIEILQRENDDLARALEEMADWRKKNATAELSGRTLNIIERLLSKRRYLRRAFKP